MQIKCKSCGAKILAEDVNLQKTLAKCRGCNAVFDFSGQLEPERGPAPRPPVPLPARFRLEDRGREMTISWRWFTPKILFLACFCAAWDSFLVFWYSIAFGANAPWIMKVFPVAHLAVGVGLTYAVLAGFWNRTFVRISADSLSILHTPLPWRGNRTLPASDINQIYCTQGTGRGSDSSSTSYDLNATTRDGLKVMLLSGLEEAEQALFLEQAIESRLGIADRPVGGELPR